MYVLRLPQIKKQVKARTNIQLTGHLLFIVLIMPKFAFIKFCNIFILQQKRSENYRYNASFKIVFRSFFAYIFCQGQNFT